MTTFEQDLLKIIVDKLLIGVLLAFVAYYVARLIERQRTNLGYRQNLALQRLEACKLRTTMISEFHLEYLSWLDDLESLLRKLERDEASADDIERALLRWNTVHSPFKKSIVVTLLPVVPVPLAQSLGAYLDIAGTLPNILKAGPAAVSDGSATAKEPLRESLMRSHGEYLATYAELLATGSLSKMEE